VELVISVLVLAATLILAAGLLPLTGLLRDNSGAYSRAATVIQRKIEQIRSLDPSLVTPSGLRTAAVVDPTAPSTGAMPFTTVENLTTILRQGSGDIVLTNSGTDLVTVDVTVRWTTIRGAQVAVSARTLVTLKDPWLEQ
jgi:hypothetical protein